jgi:diacylglycerol kinase family enzyme
MIVAAPSGAHAAVPSSAPVVRRDVPASERCFLVINPGSHHGRSRETAALYRALLAADARTGPAAIDCGYTRTLEDARDLARRALAEGYDTIVAVGGDGTINRLVNAFLEPGAKQRGARLGVLYSGTSPDFCRFHGIPTDPAAAVRALRAGVARPIDICRITHRDAAGGARVDHFASSANIGLGAGIAARANRMRPRLGDFLGTLLASVTTIARRGPQRVRLIVDGEDLAIASALNISVGKNPYLASGLKLDTDVAAADGRLFVFAVCGIGRAQLLGALPRIYSGSIARDPRFVLRRASVVRVEPLEGRLATEFDGDPAGFCPAEIRVLPGALQLIGARS